MDPAVLIVIHVRVLSNIDCSSILRFRHRICVVYSDCLSFQCSNSLHFCFKMIDDMNEQSDVALNQLGGKTRFSSYWQLGSYNKYIVLVYIIACASNCVNINARIGH